MLPDREINNNLGKYMRILYFYIAIGVALLIAIVYDARKSAREDYYKKFPAYETHKLRACIENDSDSDCFTVAFHCKSRFDYENAKIFYEKICDKNSSKTYLQLSCAELGDLYNNGLGVRQNKNTAKEYYGKSCDYGFQLGCQKYRELNEIGY